MSNESNLWDTVKTSKLNAKESELQNASQTQEGLQQNECSKMKSKNRTKSRQSKNALDNHYNVGGEKKVPEKGKEKILLDYKPVSKYFEGLKRFPKDENNNAPVIILHQRCDKPFHKSKEHISVDNKYHLSPDRAQLLKDYKIKAKYENVDNHRSKCKEKVDGTSSSKNLKPSRHKVKNRLFNYALSETPNVNAEPKLKIKKHNIHKQVSPAVDSLSNPNNYIINQMKSLPIRMEDKPLTFMNLFRTAHVFNGYKDQKKFEAVIKEYCEKLKQGEKKDPQDISEHNSQEHLIKVDNTESFRKRYIRKRASSKLIKGVSSRKRVGKCKNRYVMLKDASKICMQENCANIPKGLNNIRSRKDLRRKRNKYLKYDNSTVNNDLFKKLETFLSNEKVSLNSIKVNNKSLHGDYFKERSCNYRPECGDGAVDEFSNQPSSQNNKLSTIFSESFTTGMAEKDSTVIDQSNADTKNHGDFEMFSKSHSVPRNSGKNTCVVDKSPIIQQDVGKISIVKPTVSDDGKKLTFQLVKGDLVQKNISKLNKQFYKIDNKRFLKASKGRSSVNKDKLMLFYTQRESSCTSKDSLNIAISRDTEMSNNGNSNNVLNVVIKQTKSSLSNSKTPSLRDFNLEKGDCQRMNDLNFRSQNIYGDYKINDNGSENFGCRTYRLLAGSQTETSIIDTNSQDVVSKQSIFHYKDDDDQNQYLNNKEFSFCLQHNLEETNKIPLKNNSLNRLLHLKSSPETADIEKLPQYMLDPESKITVGSRSVSPSHQNNLTNQKKCPGNSPKRNKSYIVGYGNTNNETNQFQLVGNKYTHGVNIQNGPINSHKLCNNNQQSQKDHNHLEFKLQAIGLPKKTSFVKVIESDNIENFTNEGKNVYKTVENNELENKEKHVQLFGQNIDNEIKKEYYIPTRRNNVNKLNISKYEDIRKRFYSFKTETSVNNINSQIQTKESVNTESKEDYVPMAIKHHLIKEENCLIDFNTTEDVKQNKEHFVTILPVEENHTVETNTNSETIEKTCLNEQVAEKKEEIIVCSEVGVQTDFPICHSGRKFVNSPEKSSDAVLLPNEVDKNCTKVTNYINKTLFSQDSNRFENNKTLWTPGKRSSFVHIVSNRISERTNSCGYRPDYKEPTGSVLNKTIQNSIANKDKICNQLISEKHHTEEQLITKVNAIYEFLQYLHKILKNTALGKQSEICNTSSNNMGSLNKTLRCLCSNCIEILNKIEVNQTANHEHGKCLRSPKRKVSSQFTKKRSLFISQVSPQRELEWRKDDDSNVEYRNIREVENSVHYGLQRSNTEPKTLKCNPKPFFVVVPSNESLTNNSIHQSHGDVSEQPLLQYHELKKESNNVLNSNELYFYMEDEIDNMLLKKKINNSELSKTKGNNSKIFCNGKQENERRLKSYTVGKHNNEFTCNNLCKTNLCKKEIRETNCFEKGLFNKRFNSYIPQKSSSFLTLTNVSKKTKNGDNNNFLQVNDTISKVSSSIVEQVKSANSDSSLVLRLRKTVNHKSLAQNNHTRKYDSYICKSQFFGDDSAHVLSLESRQSDKIHEQNLETNKLDVGNAFDNNLGDYGDKLERKVDHCIYENDLTNKTKMETQDLLRNQQNAPYIPFYLASNTYKVKNESCQPFVKRIYENATSKNEEKLLTRNVSKNKQAVKRNELKNKPKRLQGIQYTAGKKSAFLNPGLYEYEDKSYSTSNCNTNKSDSEASIDTYTCTDNLGKNRVYKNKTVLTKSVEINYLKKQSCSRFQNNDESEQLMQNSILRMNHPHILEGEVPILNHCSMSTSSVTRSQVEIPERKASSTFTLQKFDSNSSIDSLFNPNKKTLVFTNRHLPCYEDLKSSNNSSDCHQEITEISEKKAISNENTIFDSPGWISISSCELHNENKSAILSDSVLPNDLEKVRLQMDIKLNDVMHVEFFCQPSDPVKLSKDTNKSQFEK